MARTDLPSIEALTAAYLFTLGKTQEQIAAALSLSQPQVSRLLRSVRDKHIRVQKQFIWDQYAESKRQEIESKVFPRQLGAKLQRFAEAHKQQVPIVHSVQMPADAEGEVDTFAKLAAQTVKDLLLTAKGSVGVTWGNTIWHLTQALSAVPPYNPWRSHDPLQFVPLCGDPVMDSLEHYADRTSSRIASDLSKLVNGAEGRPAWLGLVPAFIPPGSRKARSRNEHSSAKGSDIGKGRRASLEEDEKRVIWRMINRVPQYPRIFGPANEPLADDLHMILTASGSARSLVSIGQSLLALTPHESDTLTKNILGDIGGVIVPKVTAVAGGQQAQEPHPIVREVTDCWTGLKMKHLRRCADQAFATGDLRGVRPGVTLLSFGPDRASIVLEAIKHGLVNHLIISSDLELAIEKSLDAGR